MDPRQYHYLDASGNQAGPVPRDQLGAMALAGQISPASLVWTEGWPEWRPASSVEGLQFAPPISAASVLDAPRTPWGIPAMPPKWYSPESFKALTIIAITGAGIATLGYIAGMAVMFTSIIANDGGDPDEEAVLLGMGLMLISMLVGAAGAICGYFLVYRWWRQIQDGSAETGPGKAVGFLFIPFFQYYWYFVAFWGLSKDLDAYTARHGIDAPSAMPGFALATVISTLVLGVMGFCLGFFAVLLFIPLAVMWFVMIVRYSKVSAVIAEHLRRVHGGAAPFGA